MSKCRCIENKARAAVLVCNRHLKKQVKKRYLKKCIIIIQNTQEYSFEIQWYDFLRVIVTFIIKQCFVFILFSKYILDSVCVKSGIKTRFIEVNMQFTMLSKQNYPIGYKCRTFMNIEIIDKVPKHFLDQRCFMSKMFSSLVTQ